MGLKSENAIYLPCCRLNIISRDGGHVAFVRIWRRGGGAGMKNMFNGFLIALSIQRLGDHPLIAVESQLLPTADPLVARGSA